MWDPADAGTFRKNIESKEFADNLDNAASKLQNSVEEALSIFMETLTSNIDCMKKKIKINPNCPSKNRVPWFDNKCRDARRETRKKAQTLQSKKESIRWKR